MNIDFPQEAVDALNAGDRVSAVKKYRQATGATLKVALSKIEGFVNPPNDEGKNSENGFIIIDGPKGGPSNTWSPKD